MEMSDQIARNEHMSIFHAKYGAQTQDSKAELNATCGGTYDRNR
jgi:hypothetical protein